MGIQTDLILDPDDIKKLRILLQRIRSGAIQHNSERMRPEGFDDLSIVYQWLPGNLFVGPTGGGEEEGSKGNYKRNDDPKDDFESKADTVTKEEAFRHLKDANRAIKQYLEDRDRSTARKAIIALSAIARRNKVYQINPDDWRLENKRYRLRGRDGL